MEMSKEYDDYLENHIHYVKRAFNWIIDNLYLDLDYLILRDWMSIVYRHDASKLNPEEYEGYDQWFYGENLNREAFDLAWLHHIHNNPHHWQHWVLINDDDLSTALEMDEVFVIEMISDWWSFSWKDGNLYEIFSWYDHHKDHMILHPNTRAMVESILDRIRQKLDEKTQQ